MATEFISFLPPPGDAIAAYDRAKPSSDQPRSVPATFCEAMSVREEVFVQEQHVPIAHELDADDPRSYHWVAYASVGNRSRSAGAAATPTDRKGSTASRVAVGTIRLVPPPHPPHPEPGTSHMIDNKEDASPAEGEGEGGFHRRTSMHDGREPYVKLGRLATLAPFRGLGLARLLVNAALQWAAANPETILPPPSPTSREQARVDGEKDEGQHKWRGLILVHAQVDIQAMWGRLGFVRDEGMGTWDEEGIVHVGMWRRIRVKDP